MNDLIKGTNVTDADDRQTKDRPRCGQMCSIGRNRLHCKAQFAYLL